MSDPVALDPEALGQLDDQQWRRLGVTQTFDRLLVAPHFRLSNSGLFTPDLGGTRILAVSASSSSRGDAMVPTDDCATASSFFSFTRFFMVMTLR